MIGKCAPGMSTTDPLAKALKDPPRILEIRSLIVLIRGVKSGRRGVVYAVRALAVDGGGSRASDLFFVASADAAMAVAALVN